MQNGFPPMVVALAVAVGLVLPTQEAAAAPPEAPHQCQSGVSDEPPCNPYLAPDGGTHRDGYRQQSYPYPTAPDGQYRAEHAFLPGVVPIWAYESTPYPNGERVIWASMSGTNQVVKLDQKSLRTYATTPPVAASASVGTAYYELNSNNQVIRIADRAVEAFGDVDPAIPSSPIRSVARYSIPDEFFCRAEQLTGVAHTYDGRLVVGTEFGDMIVLPADPTEWQTSGVLAHYSVNGPRCDDPAVPEADLEQLTNNFAVDEDGGIYPATTAAQYRLDWDGSALAATWRTEYQTSPTPSAVSLGRGTGSTPTLMGTSAQEDRFVVLTDEQPVRNLVLMWRDEIPADWTPIAPGRDPRIACEVEIDFGDGRTRTTTEQSVAVAGHSAVVVDNQLQNDERYAAMPRYNRVAASGLAGGDPAQTAHGVARVDWDPQTRSCRTVWENPTASFPNGVPMISRGSDVVLGNSLQVQPDGRAVFGVHALDLGTGESRWFVPGAAQECAPGVVAGLLATGTSTVSGEMANNVPTLTGGNACENGFYSGMTMGSDGSIYTGTIAGISRFAPKG